MRINKGTAVLLVLAVLVCFAACRNEETIDADKSAITQFVKYFDERESLQILQLDRWDVSDAEVYYYIKWVCPEGGDLKSDDHLIVYNRNTTLIKRVFFGDMEAGYNSKEKEVWDELKDTSPDKTFTESEIEELKQIAMKHYKK